MRRALVGVWVVAFAACASATNYKSADTVEAGELDWFVAPQAAGGGPQETRKALVPEIAFGARYGLRDRVELGGTATLLPLGEAVTSWSVEAAGKAQVWRPAGRSWSVAAGLGAGYRSIYSSGAYWEAVHASLPVTLGWDLGEHHLAVSTSGQVQRWYSTGARPVTVPSVGLSLGFRWRVSRRVSLFPEVSTSRAFTRLNGLDHPVLLHVGLGIFFR